MRPHPQRYTLFPYTTLFRSEEEADDEAQEASHRDRPAVRHVPLVDHDRGRVGADRVEGAVAERDLIDKWNRSEEHTSELQSHHDLVCRLLLEKKKKNIHHNY